MENSNFEELTGGQIILKIFLRILAILAATVWISVVFKCAVEIGVFSMIRRSAARRVIFCLTEFLLLGIYWYFLYVFSGFCLQRTPSVKAYYLWTVIVFAVFAGVYWLSYMFFSYEIFTWIFRLTLNLGAVRFVTSVPEEPVPYMLVYLAVTFLVMLAVPIVEKTRYLLWKRRIDREIY